ncbi:MAG: LysM peptidoglycan-binding domain-containing protein [Desulfopila sp.]
MTILRAYVFFIPVILITLTGCAPKGVKRVFDDLVGLNQEDTQKDIRDTSSLPAVTEQSPAPPEELLPQPVEAEQCIAEELDALEKAGPWEKPEARPIQQKEPKYDFPVVMNKQVEMYLELFQNRQKTFFERWLARSTKYKDLIHSELEQAGLPRDLLYLAMIESGFNQRARSYASATGMWQFMKGTGKDYNLNVDRYIDERRNAVKSTKAAVDYLADLYNQFNDWHLAVAAYNGGPGTIRNGLKKYNVTTFWELAEKRYLRLETKRYVPKLIAAILIAKNPQKYGFDNIRYAERLQFDTLDVGPGFSLDALALVCDSSKKDIRLLNQELKTGKTPLNQKKYTVNIPKNSRETAQQNLSRLHSVVKTGYKTHIAKSNESLSSICRKYNINTTTLLKVNNLRDNKLRNGQRLRIPYSTVDYMLVAENGASVAGFQDNLILHTIKSGETVSTIARQYSVPQQLIVSWNGLESVHKIRAGQQIALYVVNEGQNISASGTTDQKVASATSRAKSAGKSNVIVLAGSNKKQAAAKSSSDMSWYDVKTGDSLWTISRRFNTSPKKIKRWNNLTSDLIHPGSKLKLRDV